MERQHPLLHRIRQSRGFLFALIAVVVVWMLSSMSENRRFRESYRVVYDGLDTARYAVLAKDSTVTLDLTSNGFHTFNRAVGNRRTIHLNIGKIVAKHKSTQADSRFVISLGVDENIDLIRSQIDMRGVKELKPVGDKLTITLAPRHSKAFVPDISAVDFQFEGMMGLSGKPVIKPDSIVLYGSRESLDKVTTVSAARQTLKHIRVSGRYSLRIDSSWAEYPDLRISASSIEVWLPVELFIEKKLTIPVQLTDEHLNGGGRVRLYPSEVEVTCLVPRNEYSRVKASDFTVAASLPENDKYITPHVTRFPVAVRVKSVSPSQLQYLIIK